MLTPVVVLWSQTRQRAPSLKDDTFRAFWRGDDLADLSSVNMLPKRIKVRDGAEVANIKIL
ncbi:hypothetical protein CWR43_18625 [Rhizobium sullae]|uniref:Uncharacterized protein n=1 Tax=Rhizobium sullae TaxID=50338 RepID=A0A2N0D7P3_RHISU|nr:hypothetical protein CWR43_18625 [Rhizobium sullae]